MRKVEGYFQRLEQRYALFTPGPARADHFWETVSPAPADVVRTTLFKLDSKAKNRPAHRKADSTDRVADSAVRDGPPYQSVTDVLTAPCSPITSHLSPLTSHGAPGVCSASRISFSTRFQMVSEPSAITAFFSKACCWVIPCSFQLRPLVK